MGLNINGNIITSTTLTYDGYGAKYNIGDGSSSSNPARSGWDLKLNYPSKTSGTYWIKSESMPNALQMYVNMDSDCDGGGYDFYTFSGNGTATSYANQTNSGAALGLDLIYPRSQGHFRAIYRYIVNVLGASLSTYLQTVGKVYETSITVATGAYPGYLNGNYTSYIMRDPRYYSTGAPDWRVPDGGRWWLRDSTFSEPNGDQYAYGFLGLYGAGYALNSDGSLTGFNDGGAYSTGTSYLVSTNLKG